MTCDGEPSQGEALHAGQQCHQGLTSWLMLLLLLLLGQRESPFSLRGM